MPNVVKDINIIPIDGKRKPEKENFAIMRDIDNVKKLFNFL